MSDKWGSQNILCSSTAVVLVQTLDWDTFLLSLQAIWALYWEFWLLEEKKANWWKHGCIQSCLNYFAATRKWQIRFLLVHVLNELGVCPEIYSERWFCLDHCPQIYISSWLKPWKLTNNLLMKPDRIQNILSY